jgi:hypothetical protein
MAAIQGTISMEEQELTAVLRLFKENHNRCARSCGEAILWALEEGLICTDELGSYTLVEHYLSNQP